MMKPILSIFLLLVRWSAFAQEFPFSNTAARWFVADTYPHGNLENPSFLQVTTQIHLLCGEDNIEGEAWSRICLAADSASLTTPQFVGWVRDSSRTVFYRDTLENEELLYDFALQVGDSVLNGFDPNMLIDQQEYMYVREVDSVLVDGTYRSRILFDTLSSGAFSWFFDVWIEGIGSVHGPLSPNNPQFFGGESPNRRDLTCYWNEENELWHNPLFEDCYVQLILGTSVNADNDFRIYPNPSNGIFWLDGPYEQRNLHVMDVHGRTVLQQKTSGNTVDLTGEPDGIYFLSIVSEKGTRTLRLVKAP